MSENFRQQALDLITQVTRRKHSISYPVLLVQLLDDHRAAALLMQILYWGDRTADPDGWFYKTYADWKREIGLSMFQVRRCIEGDPRTRSARPTLRELGVETHLKKVKSIGSPVMHYRVNRELFIAALVKYLEAKHGYKAEQPDQQCEDCPPDNAPTETHEVQQHEASPLNNVHDTPSTSLTLPPQQCAESLSDQVITYQKNPTSMDYDHSMPTPHPDDDSDFELFKSYEKRFGKAKKGVRVDLLAQRERLGTPRVTEVLARCAGRGRSWQYVLRALANETAAIATPQTAYSEPYTLPDPLEMLAEWKAAQPAEESADDLPKSTRVESEIGNKTALQVWKAAAHQLELQLDRREFETWLKGSRLVDFDAEKLTFVIASPHTYARDYCQNRIYRTIQRAVEDAASRAGEAISLRFITREDWLKREIGAA